MGSALQQGATGSNIARQIALRAGLPVTTSGMTMDRQCSSGLMAVATAAKQIMYDGMSCVVGGGLESISLVQNETHEPAPHGGRGTDGDRAEHVRAHAADRRDRGQALQDLPRGHGRVRPAIAAAHRRRLCRGQVRRRTGAGDLQAHGLGQGNR